MNNGFSYNLLWKYAVICVSTEGKSQQQLNAQPLKSDFIPCSTRERMEHLAGGKNETKWYEALNVLPLMDFPTKYNTYTVLSNIGKYWVTSPGVYFITSHPVSLKFYLYLTKQPKRCMSPFYIFQNYLSTITNTN